jgi:formylglycine-generating enzyme required for sulfatase activity
LPGSAVDSAGIDYDARRDRLLPFTMGSPASEANRSNDEIQHEVTISKPFYLGVTEVTQEQYEAVMGNNPSNFKDAKNPVERVSWDDAVEFCKKLSSKTGKTVRLPTEAEWEYACRAGTTGAYAGNGSLDDMGWYTSNSSSKTHPVGQKKPNAWGLYDMHGNVYEWCGDWYADKYPTGAAKDPTGPASGESRVLRGGSWDLYPQYCRSAYRDWLSPGSRGVDIGFSVVLDSP